jgi:ABC-type uncharacterized transport system involved in gliding motility auxiliary subunit
MAKRIFNIIGWIGTALVLGAVAVRLRTSIDQRYATWLAEGGLACMVLYIASQWREIASFFTRRQARYGTLALTSVLIALGILVAINYIGKRQNKRWDLTAAKQFSLSDQSRKVLSELKAPLDVKVFAKEQDFQGFRDRLQEYEYSSKQVTTEYVDPDKKPTIAQQNKIEQYNTIVFNYQGRSERTTANAEQDITNAIIKVVTGAQKKVYFTVGHGEKDSASSERGGYGTIVQALGRENYGVDKVVLAQAGAVPEGATAVIVAGPKTDFYPQEIDALKAYLAKNGKLLLMLDPQDKVDGTPLTGLIALAHDWGVEVTNTIVVDASGMGQLIGSDASVPVATNYPQHAITSGLNNIITAFPLSRGVVPVAGGVNGHTAQTFVETSPRSWAETDLKSLLTDGKVELNADKGDKPGPVAIAAAVSAVATEAAKDAPADAPKPETRVVVFGDSDFATNGVLGIQGNRDLFMNTVGWLSQQENLISVRPKEAEDRRLTLTATQQNNITWLSLLVVPAVIFGTGIVSWWKRR